MPKALAEKKLLIVVAGPRPKGNSAALAEEAARGAAAAGAEVKVVRLSEMAMGPCRACDLCRRPGGRGCVQDDDIKALRDAIRDADGLLIATPVYWFTMSAQAKIFMDRLYVFGDKKYREMKGKRIGLILASGDTDPQTSGAVNAMHAFQDAFAYLGAPIAGMVFCGGGKIGAAGKNKVLMEEAFVLGRSLGS